MAQARDVPLVGAETQVRVQFLAASAVRITYAPLGAEFTDDRPWLEHVLPSRPRVPPEEAALRVALNAPGGLVCVTTRDGHVVFGEAAPPRLAFGRRARSLVVDIPATDVRREVDQTDAAVSLSLAIQPGEGFYGWGEWFSHFRRERGQVKLRIRDAIAMIQDRETYSAIPLFFSSRGYAFWLLNSHESVWTIDPARGVLDVEAAGPPVDYVVVYGPAFRDILATYTGLTGRPPLLPRWALGLMVTGYPQEPQTTMLARVAEHRARRLPLDALILDYHWEERYHNFQWRKALFPDPDRLLAELKAQGVRVGLIFTPFVNHRNRPGQRRFLQTLARNLPVGSERDDERALPEYADALAKGYLAHPDTKWWFGAGGMLDFANPQAAAWWNNHLAPLYRQGVAFFKNDDGEYVPPDARSALGIDGREYHNLYGFFYGRAIYDGMQALDDRRAFIYARSVWAGSQRYPALFLGDQKPTFEHIRSTLRAGLNLGLLGFAHWTADVFGLDGKTTSELHTRYAQWALLVPVARYFWRPPEIDGTRFPWSHGPQAEANFRSYSELRYRLLPYYHNLGWEAHLTGMPVVRPLLLEYQDDPRLADLCDQVLLGDGLMLAPVLTPVDAATRLARRRVVLPAGPAWHDFWSTDTFPGGGEIDYPAPLDRMPILVRGGSILPMGPVLQSIPDDHRFDRLELHCWPPYPAEMTFYDDDGRSRAYQRGAYSTTRLRVEGDPAAGRVTVLIEAAHGSFPDQPVERQVEVWLHRGPRPAALWVNGEEIPAPAAWRYDEVRKEIVVPLVCPVSRATVVEVRFSG